MDSLLRIVASSAMGFVIKINPLIAASVTASVILVDTFVLQSLQEKAVNSCKTRWSSDEDFVQIDAGGMQVEGDLVYFKHPSTTDPAEKRKMKAILGVVHLISLVGRGLIVVISALAMTYFGFSAGMACDLGSCAVTYNFSHIVVPVLNIGRQLTAKNEA